MSTPERVFIHVNADGCYQGNGGLVSLLGLAEVVMGMGFDVALFDHLDRLHVERLAWTCYPVPRIAPAAEVLNQPDERYAVVTTWVHTWLDVLQAAPRLWEHLRYWCTSELLRPELERSRAFVREHIWEIAICNPALRMTYAGMGMAPVWYWGNWVRDLFHADDDSRGPGTVGIQPDHNGDEALDVLAARFGERVRICTGTQQEVAEAMRRCDLFLYWNKQWPLLCGDGETFGLAMHEAMASGCAVVARRHAGSAHWGDCLPRYSELEDALCALERLTVDDALRERVRAGQGETIATMYRLNDQRREHMAGYLAR